MAKNLLVAVRDHDYSENDAHQQKRQWLQAIEVAQTILPVSVKTFMLKINRLQHTSRQKEETGPGV